MDYGLMTIGTCVVLLPGWAWVATANWLEASGSDVTLMFRFVQICPLMVGCCPPSNVPTALGPHGDRVGAAGAAEKSGLARNLIRRHGIGHDELDGAVGIHCRGHGHGHHAHHDGLIAEAVLRRDRNPEPGRSFLPLPTTCTTCVVTGRVARVEDEQPARSSAPRAAVVAVAISMFT